MKIRFIFLVIGFIAVGIIGYSLLSSDKKFEKVKPVTEVLREQRGEIEEGKLTQTVLEHLQLEADLKDFDQDRDGQLNTAEEENRNNAIDERIVVLRKLRLEKYDFNGSGVLDPQEVEKGKVLFYKSLLEVYDKNENGRLSSLEQNQAHKYYIDARRLPDFPITAPS